MPGPSTRLVTVFVTAALLAACDVGDGTTLREPTASTTLPPPDTTPPDTVPLDDPVPAEPALDGAPAIESLPAPVATDEANQAAEPGSGDGIRLFTPWADAAPIDVIHTCDGANSSPSLSWTDVPEGTQELAISLVDETNLSNGRPFIHWVLAGIDPGVGRLGENEVPPGALRGLNFFGDVGYTGPCPNPGDTNTYTLTLFALGQQLELADGTPAAELLDVIGTVAITSASSTGTVTR